MPSTRDIRRRIRSITNTQQITKAMQMVAAAKMRKAQEAALRTRLYAKKALSLLSDLSLKTNLELHPLLRKVENKKVLLILVTTDKGLCGGLNVNIFKKAINFVQEQIKNGREVEFICVGKKGRDFMQRHGFKIIAEFLDFGDKFNLLDMSAVAQIPLQEHRKKTYSKIYLLYTDFLSTLRYEPCLRQLLPIEREELIKLSELGKNIKSSVFRDREKKVIDKTDKKKKGFEYIFEPSADEVLEVLLPRLCEMQIYQAVLESNASEHSSRMVTMKNATDAAGDIIADLQLTFNQARQAAITREIAEISAGSLK
ncbi:MAG: ATP synthase F1 subunit gamma [Patescibacteria group bacterium]